MPEESQFHMTVVTQKRVLRHRAEEPSGADAEEAPHGREAVEDTLLAEPAPLPASRIETPLPGPETREVHRRHYKDYGTLDLGVIETPAHSDSRGSDPTSAPEPSKGQLQKEFYNRYDSALSRRYSTRNKNKVTRWIIIALLVGLILVVGLIAVSTIQNQIGDTITPPNVETIPVHTLDLG